MRCQIMNGKNFKEAYMSILDYLDVRYYVNKSIVKTGRSKGPGRPATPITVGDIKRGIVTDENGYDNEIVLFLRKNKADK
jgi:hypothetical protein